MEGGGLTGERENKREPRVRTNTHTHTKLIKTAVLHARAVYSSCPRLQKILQTSALAAQSSFTSHPQTLQKVGACK